MMGLTDAADRPAGTYSGGMIRRLELAQALVSSPRLLILDEPTIGLDPVARSGVWERIAEVREQTNMTVLITTHYMDEAEQFCDRVALMHRGQVRAIDTPAALIEGLGVAGGDARRCVPRVHRRRLGSRRCRTGRRDERCPRNSPHRSTRRLTADA